MWFPFGDDGRIPVDPQWSPELESEPPVPLSSPDFYRIWKSFGAPLLTRPHLRTG